MPVNVISTFYAPLIVSVWGHWFQKAAEHGGCVRATNLIKLFSFSEALLEC